MSADVGGIEGAVIPSARDRILQTATVLFYRHGFRAVGVDAIIAQSGVAKMTLYRHFPSKDDLIVAYLRNADAKFWAWFDGVAATQPGPREKLLAVFESLQVNATSPACLGCAFQEAAGEFPEPDSAAHELARSHKKAVLARLFDLAEEAGAANPAALAEQLLLIMDGALAAARMFGPRSSPAASSHRAAESLIRAELDGSPAAARP